MIHSIKEESNTARKDLLQPLKNPQVWKGGERFKKGVKMGRPVTGKGKLNADQKKGESPL